MCHWLNIMHILWVKELCLNTVTSAQGVWGWDLLISWVRVTLQGYCRKFPWWLFPEFSSIKIITGKLSIRVIVHSLATVVAFSLIWFYRLISVCSTQCLFKERLKGGSCHAFKCVLSIYSFWKQRVTEDSYIIQWFNVCCSVWKEKFNL